MTHKSSKKHAALHHSERFINRELSWLAFNRRVLEEAANPHNPLLERVRFLSISAANIDEFIMVRVAGLMDHLRLGSTLISPDGLNATQQLEQINSYIQGIVEQQHSIWDKLHTELNKESILLLSPDKLSAKDTAWLKEYFLGNLYPALTPITIDPAHPFPFLPNLGIAQLFLFSAEGKKQEQTAVLPFPQKLPRFIALPQEKKGKKSSYRYVTLEDVIELNWHTLFPSAHKHASTLLRITRDSDLDIEDEAEDLVRHFERAVKERRRGRIIRVKLADNTTPALMQFILSQMHVAPEDVVISRGLIGFASLLELVECPRPDLKYPLYTPRFPERIADYSGDYFAAIEAKDIVVHHPFESFDVVVAFLRQAALDKDVVSIKQTLYRTSADSPIVQALIAAAEAGKSVTAVVELRARFDEEANIKWARDLERAGAQVVYGLVQLKTHTKISLVTRKAEGTLRSFMHFGTGNYHPATAKIYTDLSYFTCNPALCHDAAQIFNFLTGYTAPKALAKMVITPLDMRDTLLGLIDKEIAHAKAGKPATIWAKMNALVDPVIIDALYRASQHNVKIELIIRGICCLRPGVAGLSENIRVKSIVGRFLEHARIFCFGAGHELPSPHARTFISSADWMPRNFDWRVEAMLPVENATVHAQIMGQIMLANISDERNSWILGADGVYTRTPYSAKQFSAHEYFMHNPSLSGRGKALKKKIALEQLYKLRKKRR